jgi:GNAT superfamily N-acetyltransferase
MKNALFYVAKDTSSPDPNQVVGVSMWVKPRHAEAPTTWSQWWDENVLWFKQGLNLLWYQGRGGLRTDRYWIWKREQQIAQTELWTDPQGYYFVNIVTVRPEGQGKGVGRKLFEVVTKQADVEGRRCYLESSKAEPNIRIYEKMGFDMRKKMTCVSEDGEDAKVELFCMMREPKGASSNNSS